MSLGGKAGFTAAIESEGVELSARQVSQGTQLALDPTLAPATKPDQPRRRGPNKRTKQVLELLKERGDMGPLDFLSRIYNAQPSELAREMGMETFNAKHMHEVKRMQVSAAIAALPYAEQKLPPLEEPEQNDRFIVIGDVDASTHHALGELGFSVDVGDDGKIEDIQTLSDVDYDVSHAEGSDDAE